MEKDYLTKILVVLKSISWCRMQDAGGEKIAGFAGLELCCRNTIPVSQPLYMVGCTGTGATPFLTKRLLVSGLTVWKSSQPISHRIYDFIIFLPNSFVVSSGGFIRHSEPFLHYTIILYIK